MTKPKIVSKELDAEVGLQWVAEEIESIAKAVEGLQKTRVTVDLLIALIHDNTGIAKGTIRSVLLSAKNIEKTYLR